MNRFKYNNYKFNSFNLILDELANSNVSNDKKIFLFNSLIEEILKNHLEIYLIFDLSQRIPHNEFQNLTKKEKKDLFEQRFSRNLNQIINYLFIANEINYIEFEKIDSFRQRRNELSHTFHEQVQNFNYQEYFDNCEEIINILIKKIEYYYEMIFYNEEFDN